MPGTLPPTARWPSWGALPPVSHGRRNGNPPPFRCAERGPSTFFEGFGGPSCARRATSRPLGTSITCYCRGKELGNISGQLWTEYSSNDAGGTPAWSPTAGVGSNTNSDLGPYGNKCVRAEEETITRRGAGFAVLPHLAAQGGISSGRKLWRKCIGWHSNVFNISFPSHMCHRGALMPGPSGT